MPIIELKLIDLVFCIPFISKLQFDISTLPPLSHKLQGLAVYFDGGTADVEELVADDDLVTLDALDERHATGKGTVGDAHLVALSERTVDEGGVAGVYDAAEIVELGIGDDVGSLLAGHRQHLVYVGTETDVVEVASLHPNEDEGGEDHELAYAALAAAVDHYTPLSGHPGFDRKAATLEVLLYGEHEFLLVVDPHTCHIPRHPVGVSNGCFGGGFDGLRYGFAVVPCNRGRI